MEDPVEGLAAEPSSLSSLQLDLAQQPGAEEVLDEAATARAQARHMTLSADAEGALNMLKHLEGLPNLKSYDALRAGLHGAKGVAFLTQQSGGLGLAYLSGTGFVMRRFRESCAPGQSPWSAPCYYRCRGVSLGAIAGYEYLQTLLCIHSDAELERFMHGELHLGLDVTLMAGSDLPRECAGRPAKIDSAAPGDVLAFCIAAGIKLSLSLELGVTRVNHRLNRRVFGGDAALLGAAKVTPQQLLGGQVEAPREFDELADVLERLAAPRLRRLRTDAQTS